MWGRDRDREEKEATWEDYSVAYKEYLREFTFSQFDKPQKPTVYFIEADVPEVSAAEARIDFVPTNFISCYTIFTHEGNICIGYLTKNKFAFKRLLDIKKKNTNFKSIF